MIANTNEVEMDVENLPVSFWMLSRTSRGTVSPQH